MNMQDDEFDELFRSKLNDFEAEPSTRVWTGIVAGLDKEKFKKIGVPFLGIAASILILITAGVLFIPQKSEVNSSHPAKDNDVKSSLSLATGPITKQVSEPGISKVKPGNKLKGTRLAANNGTLEATEAIKQNQANKQNDSTDVKSTPVDPAAFATLSNKQNDVIRPAVPDESTQIAIQLPEQVTSSFIVKPVQMITSLPGIKIEDASAKPKHKVRNLGDLINVVVAAVDTRKDKIIEFTDADDDGPTITSVNLGLIKIKKDK